MQLSDDPSTGVEVMSLGESKGEIDIDHLEKGQHVSYVYSRIHVRSYCIYCMAVEVICVYYFCIGGSRARL